MEEITVKDAKPVKSKPNTIPPTIQEETSVDLTTMESPLQTGLIKHTNLAVDKFRQLLKDHEAAIAQVKWYEANALQLRISRNKSMVFIDLHSFAVQSSRDLIALSLELQPGGGL